MVECQVGIMLHEFLLVHRAAIIARTGTRAAKRAVAGTAAGELAGGIALFLDQLIAELQGSALARGAIGVTATQQGDEMLRTGAAIGDVVHAYADLGEVVRELVFEHNVPIIFDEVQLLNRCLDDAIANAVTAYERLREEALVNDATERFGMLVHELRNRLNSATLSFALLKSGTVSPAGRTGAVLERSLQGIAALIDEAVAGVRAESATQRCEPVDLAQFVNEVEAQATIEAKARGQKLTVAPAETGVVVEVNREALTTAVGNLLQNAFKFSQKGGEIQFRTRVTADRVLLDVEDECGGLPHGGTEDLFRPFTQRNDDRSGLGLGLPISRNAIRLNGGELHVRNIAGHGCIFTVDLPRKDMAAA
jgi:signal transduction histidine kinase